MNPDTTWKAFRACQSKPIELFLTPADVDQIDKAVAVCHQCPVEDDCLVWTLQYEARQANGEVPYRYHILGGTRPDERTRLAEQMAEQDPPLAGQDLWQFITQWREQNQ